MDQAFLTLQHMMYMTPFASVFLFLHTPNRRSIRSTKIMDIDLHNKLCFVLFSMLYSGVHSANFKNNLSIKFEQCIWYETSIMNSYINEVGELGHMSLLKSFYFSQKKFCLLDCFLFIFKKRLVLYIGLSTSFYIL